MIQVRNVPMENIRGRPCRIPKRDLTGELMPDPEKPEIAQIAEARVATLLEFIIYSIPIQRFTRQYAIHATRLWGQIQAAVADEVAVLDIETAEWEWVMSKLEDDAIGPKVFGLNCYTLERQLRDAVIQPDAKKDGAGGHDAPAGIIQGASINTAGRKRKR